MVDTNFISMAGPITKLIYIIKLYHWLLSLQGYLYQLSHLQFTICQNQNTSSQDKKIALRYSRLLTASDQSKSLRPSLLVRAHRTGMIARFSHFGLQGILLYLCMSGSKHPTTIHHINFTHDKNIFKKNCAASLSGQNKSYSRAFPQPVKNQLPDADQHSDRLHSSQADA